MRRMYSKNQLDLMKKDITTLVDSEGHNRFIEGDINLETISGLTKLYGKWSLSGTHLLIVFALKIEQNLSSANVFYLDDLPEWVQDKIVAIAGTRVVTGTGIAYSEDASTNVNFYYTLNKTSSHITLNSTCNINEITRNTRVQIDLLIDNE